MSEELRRLAYEARDSIDGGWFNAPFLRAFIDDDDAAVFEEPDVAYIVAASPRVILGLLDRIAELERSLKSRISEYGDNDFAEWINGVPYLVRTGVVDDLRNILAARSSSKVE